MKASLEEIMRALPDFDDLSKLAEEISTLMYRKLILDKEIKSGESDVFKICTTNEKYFLGGKPAPMSYIDNTYKFGGVDGELLPYRTELAEVVSKLERARLRFEIYKNMLDVWRTLSANERSSSL